MNTERLRQIVSSSLWAAYGDALGFPTELASESIINKRIGKTVIDKTQPWKRIVGGKFGANVDLPAGAYSDDTQLRMATSRALLSRGGFDVESFAKVELPIWLSYSLGAGRGSKTAASELGNKNVNWFSNFFDSKTSSYMQGGGNGAAMRIHPHVWSAVKLNDRVAILTDVVRNSVCTHGHVRGIAGAMIHAMSLAFVMLNKRVPAPEDWLSYTDIIELLPEIVLKDKDLSVFWLPVWESKNKESIRSAAEKAADEWAESVGVALECIENDGKSSYKRIVKALGGDEPAERGSGLKCSLFSLAAASLLEEQGANDALVMVANQRGSDTDTIATMAGALLGAKLFDSLPLGDIQDKTYLMDEAERCYKISMGEEVQNFKYPDLLYWESPRAALDAVRRSKDGLYLEGLGYLREKGEVYSSNQKGVVWQWFELPFGQTVLCKRRDCVKSATSDKVYESEKKTQKLQSPSMQDLFGLNEEKDRSIDEMTEEAIRSGFDPSIIGWHVLELSEKENGIELAISYAAIIAKAKKARGRRAK